MKKVIVILCIKLYRRFPNSLSWKFYHDILGLYISPRRDKVTLPRWYRGYIYKIGEGIKDRLLKYLQRHKNIVREYHSKVVEKKNNNNTGTYYV